MVTEEKVAAIIELDESVSPQPFIDVAVDLTTEVCGTQHSAERLDLIGTWLSAHFYTIRVNRLASEDLSFMDYSYKNQYKLGLNLESSMYGQQVLLLDTSGGFADLNKQASAGKKNRVGVTYLGTPPESSRVEENDE